LVAPKKALALHYLALVSSCVVQRCCYPWHGCNLDARVEHGLRAPLQDLPGALDDAAVAEGLGLSSIKSRDWAIFKTSAIKGDGLFEGLDWLSNMLKTRRR